MKKQEKTRAAGYIRVSTTAQAEEGESLQTQTAAIHTFVTERGWELVTMYEDRGISGSRAESRPAFMQMMKDAEQKKFAVVVFSRLSRFARNAGDFIRYTDKLKASGVTLCSIHENLDPSTTNGRLMMNLMAVISEWERELIREQMSENKLAKWRDHRLFNGRPTFGYRWDKEAKKLVLDEEEAKTYHRIVDLYLHRGLSMHTIAETLTTDGGHGERRSFSTVTVSDILKNPAYCGRYIVNRHRYEPGASGKSQRSKHLKPETEHITFTCPPLISLSEWKRIQERIAFNRVKSKRTTAEDPYWLRNILECSCGTRVKPIHGAARKDGSRPRYYGCYYQNTSAKQRQVHGKTKCGLPLIKADELEGFVWLDVIQPLLASGDELDRLIDPTRHDGKLRDLDERIKKSGDALRKREQARERVFVLYEDGGLDKNELLTRVHRLDDELRDGRATIADMNHEREELMALKNDDKGLRAFLHDKKATRIKLAKELRALSSADKKRLIESFVDGKITLDWYIAEDSGEKVWTRHTSLRLNDSMLTALQAEGKVGLFSKDGPYRPSADEFRRVDRDDENTQHHGAAQERPAAHRDTTIPFASSHDIRRGPHRRRPDTEARRGEPVP